MKRVVFLDYDGVVNRKLWERVDGKWVRRFGYPEDGRVNDGQAVQWVSEFCEKYGYDLVVTSTWRKYPEWRDALQAAGLREGIEILGATSLPARDRAEEISEYLSEHPEIEDYLVFDDNAELLDPACPHVAHLVLCKTEQGFGEEEYLQAVTTHMSLKCIKEEKPLNVVTSTPEGIPTSAGTLSAAVEVLYTVGYVSTSMLQRRLCVGYSKAAKLIDALRQRGIVLQRSVSGSIRYLPLVTYEEALQILEKIN